jgi:DNA-binding MarR family transcriptional regulator
MNVRSRDQQTAFVEQWQDVLPPASLGFRMRAVNQLMLRRYGSAFTPFEVTPYQWLVLACLWQEDGLTVSDVTNRLNQVGGTMTGILQGMEKSGMLSRQTTPEDRRIARLWLTPKGLELKDKMLPVARSVRKEVYGCLTEDEQSQLSVILDKLLANLTQPPHIGDT